MALTDMGEQVNRMVDANRGNPGALQQKHALNKDLLSLLALQKLQSEKKAAENELAMSMQGTPGTILEQREKELTGRATKEVTEGVAGALKTKQNQQQNNLQRMAGANPQMAGIAGQPAPNMARMAGGGIVAFGNGGGVKGVSDKQLKRMGLTRSEWESTLTDEGRAIYLRKFPALPADASIAREWVTGIGDYFDRSSAKEAAARKAQGYMGGARQIGALFDSGPEGRATLADLATKRAAAERIRNMGTASGVAAADPKQNAGILAEQNRMQQGQLGLPPAAAAPVSGPRPAAPVKPTGIAAPPAGPQGFAEQYKQGIANANTELGRSRMADMYKDLLAKKQAVHAKVANQQGNFFSPFAGAKSFTGASVNAKNDRIRRNRDELDRAADEFDIAEKGMTADTAAAKAALTAGGQYATGVSGEASKAADRVIRKEANQIMNTANKLKSQEARRRWLGETRQWLGNQHRKYDTMLQDEMKIASLGGKIPKEKMDEIINRDKARRGQALGAIEEQIKSMVKAGMGMVTLGTRLKKV